MGSGTGTGLRQMDCTHTDETGLRQGKWSQTDGTGLRQRGMDWTQAVKIQAVYLASKCPCYF